MLTDDARKTRELAEADLQPDQVGHVPKRGQHSDEASFSSVMPVTDISIRRASPPLATILRG